MTARKGVPVGANLHPSGDVVDLPAALAVVLESRGLVRFLPWLATRPRRRGEAPHEPTPARPTERGWWLADELADLLPVAPMRAVPRVRTVDARRHRRGTARRAA